MNERSTMSGKPVFSVPAKTVINYKSHFDKKLLCTGITFTAGSACNYSCSFCYVESMQQKQQEWFKKNGVVYQLQGHAGVVIRTANAVEIAHQQITSKPIGFRMDGAQVIYASPKVDVAGNMELAKETIEICKVILSRTNWQIRLLSKSNLLPKVAEGLEGFCASEKAKSRVIYGVSTGTLDDKLASAFEEGTAKVSKRIESLHWLQDNGFRTFAMVCPNLPQDDYTTFASDMAKALRYDRCEHVWAEVINVRGESFTKTEAALRAAGFPRQATFLNQVATDKGRWEDYSRLTFLAHRAFTPPGKLRFLQYVTEKTRPWWESEGINGAVLL